MTQMNTLPTAPTRRQAKSNVYTVLALIAVLALLTGIVAVLMRSSQVFGTANVFTLEPPKPATGGR